MGTLALTLPTIGQPNSTEDVKIPNAFSAIQTEYNTNIANILGQYKPMMLCYGSTGAFSSAATIGFVWNGPGAATIAGNNWIGGIQPYINYLAAADYAISGYTTKIRTRFTWLTNSTAPASTVTAGLYPMTTPTGGASTLQLTQGTVVSGSTVAIVSPSANSITTGVSSDITLPADGLYMPGVLTGSAAAASSAGVWNVLIEYRNV